MNSLSSLIVHLLFWPEDHLLKLGTLSALFSFLKLTLGLLKRHSHPSSFHSNFFLKNPAKKIPQTQPSIEQMPQPLTHN